MAALDVFKAIGSQVDSDFLAVDVLPILWQFSLGPLLNLSQFQAYMTLIKSLSARVENEQTRKLQELGASNAPTTSRNEFMVFAGLPEANGFDSTNGEGNDDFEALVRGTQGMSTSSDMLGGDGWASAPASASTSTMLPSRPAGHRVGSARNASPAATFSWSTAPVSPPPTNLAAPKSQGMLRTITPDSTIHSLNSVFPAMAPSNPGIGSSFPQPQANTFTGMSNMASPTAATSSYSTQSTSIDWSKASGASSPGGNPWNRSTATSSDTNALASFSMTPLAVQTPAQQSNPYSSFSIAPPPTKGTGSLSIQPPGSGGTSFNIAPPPSMGARAKSSTSMDSMASKTVPAQKQKPANAYWSGGGDSLI